MKIGYARVSAKDQTVAMQADALKKAINAGPFSRNLGRSGRIFSANVVPKPHATQSWRTEVPRCAARTGGARRGVQNRGRVR